MNDQLIEVNSEPLTGLNNSEAMEKLRDAMLREDDNKAYIDLVVTRRREANLNTGTKG